MGWWGRWHRIIGKFREESRHFQTRSLFASGYSESSHFIPSSAVMDRDIIQRLAVPGVTLLICFLAYTSQWLFLYIEPGPLRKGDTYFFNLLVACLLICFYRTCFTDPGRIPHCVHRRGRAARANRLQFCRLALRPPLDLVRCTSPPISATTDAHQAATSR